MSPWRIGRLLVSTVVLALSFSPARAADNHCPAFGPPPAGDTIVQLTPADAGDLPTIALQAQSNTTILLDDGVYAMHGYIQFGNPEVTLRSTSGNRDGVILDGGYRTSAAEILFIDEADITVADLTIRRAWYHPIHVTGGGHRVTLYNLKIEDGRQQLVKVNQSGGDYADFGLAACGELELTDAGRTFVHDNPTPGFLCYTGGFDLHQTWGWTIRDMVIRDIYCTNGGLAEHAIHFFRSNREPLVERNLILHNARGIGFGLGQEAFVRTFPDDPFAGTEMEGREDEVMHIGGTIQNNIVYADIGVEYDSGIGLESAWRPQVLHNTIYSAEGSFNSAIDVRFSGSESVLLANNLFAPRITLRNGAPTPEQHANVLATPDLFVAMAAGDLHLLETAFVAIDQGWPAGVGDDFDGQGRDAAPDVGADEWVDPNSVPAVSIYDPADYSAYGEGVTIDFAGTALDTEDGDLTASLAWTSSLDGPIGSGGSVATTLSPGLHQVIAAVTDSGGLEGSAAVSVGVTTQTCPASAAIGNQSVSGAMTSRAVFDISLGPSVTVTSSGDLELFSGESVVFGNGVAVEVGATLSASITATPCE